MQVGADTQREFEDQLANCTSIYVEETLASHFTDLASFVKRAEAAARRAGTQPGDNSQALLLHIAVLSWSMWSGYDAQKAEAAARMGQVQAEIRTVWHLMSSPPSTCLHIWLRCFPCQCAGGQVPGYGPREAAPIVKHFSASWSNLMEALNK